MPIQNCGTCRYFGPVKTTMDLDTYEDIPSSYHTCEKIKHDVDYSYVRGGGAVCVDGSGYFAAFVVEEDFGCINWEAQHHG